MHLVYVSYVKLHYIALGTKKTLCHRKWKQKWTNYVKWILQEQQAYIKNFTLISHKILTTSLKFYKSLFVTDSVVMLIREFLWNNQDFIEHNYIQKLNRVQLSCLSRHRLSVHSILLLFCIQMGRRDKELSTNVTEHFSLAPVRVKVPRWIIKISYGIVTYEYENCKSVITTINLCLVLGLFQTKKKTLYTSGRIEVYTTYKDSE